MDTTIPGIEFDESEVCSYCKLHDELEKKYSLNEAGQKKINNLINKIKKEGRSKKYDCVLGVSGGTDSTYALYIAKKMGLRPLAVHLDNGWNTEIAVSNMKKAVKKLDVDLKIIEVSWGEFKDLQLAFLKASIPEVELPTDVAIRSILYRTTAQYSLHYFISAESFREEGVVPHSWGYKDARYIRSVHKKYGKVPLKTFPNLYISSYLYFTFIRRIKFVPILNYVKYSKENAKKILKRELDWQDYGGHHYESIYTRFYQSYLAPVKFYQDRRKVRYSALIRTGKMTRKKALIKIKELLYSAEKIQKDKEHICNKLGISLEEFEEIIAQKTRTFLDFSTYYPLINRFWPILEILYKLKLTPGTFRGRIF